MVEYVTRQQAQAIAEEAVTRAMLRFQTKLQVYPLSGMPPARKGSIVFVPDASAGPAIAVGDGTNWQEYQSAGVLS